MNDTFEVDFDTNPTELYTAICAGEWENATSIVKEYPDQARTWVVRHDPEDETAILWRFLPLHSACARQPSDSLVEALLLAYPDAASAKDDQGFLPLHYACGNRASDGAVNMLLIVYPQGADVRDPYGGKLPLHHLAQWGTFSAGVVNMLLAVHPGAISEKDSSGYLPLDLAKAANYPGRNVVITALKRCMVASKMRSSETAITSSRDVDITQELDTLDNQHETLAGLSEELTALREETDVLRTQAETERSASNETISAEKEKVTTLSNQLSEIESELASVKTAYHESETDYSQHTEEIKKCRYEIISLKEDKERTIKERDTISEKLELKQKTSEDTIAKLEARIETQQQELLDKNSNLESLDAMIGKLEDECTGFKEANGNLNKEVEYLKDCKNVSDKLDVLFTNLINLQGRYEGLQKITMEQDQMFKAAVVEREQKILEIAQLEEKLRVNTSDEHDKLLNELKLQEEEIKSMMDLIQA